MSLLHKWIFLAGSKKRNPSLWDWYDYLKASERWTLEAILKEQEKRLQQAFQFAFSNSAYYKKYWGQTGKELSMNWSIDQFRQLPVITKRQLLESNDQVHCHEKLFSRTFFCETSGTSGEVLTFRRDEKWDSFNRAVLLRGLDWHNVRPWEPSLYFWGYNTQLTKQLKIRFQDWLLNRYRIFNYDESSIATLQKRLPHTKYIEGYSSVIYELAQHALAAQTKTPFLKLIKGTSEKIFPHYNDAVRKAFGKKIVSEYGAAESGIIAFECSEGNMHLNLLGVYTEVENDGEIIVTNLAARSFPVIRYRLGDAVRLASPDKDCSCGLAHPIIEEVTGRIGKNIFGVNQTYPSLILYYIFKNLYFNYGIKINYQAHQYQKGALEIWTKELLNTSEVELLMTQCTKYFRGDIQVTTTQKSNFREQQGKLRDFVSHIE